MRVSNSILAVAALLLSGCSTIGSNVKIANPNNVYRFSKNTELEVLVQDQNTGNWSKPDYKVIIPMGYYIGSGLEK